MSYRTPKRPTIYPLGSLRSSKRKTRTRRRLFRTSPNPLAFYKKRGLPRFNRKEMKFFDSIFSEAWVERALADCENDPGGEQAINLPVQGSDADERNGRMYTIKSIQIRGRVWRPKGSDQTDVNESSFIHVFLVWDKQTNGLAMNPALVYKDAGEKVMAFRDLDYSKRFQVLWSWYTTLGDKVTMPDGTDTASVAGETKYFECYKKVHIPVECRESNGSIGDIMDNSLHVCALSSQITVDKIKWTSRIRFVG